MDHRDFNEIATELRKLLRRSDRFGYDLQRLKEEILFLAEAKEKYAEHLEMQMIIQMQQDWVEAN
jgi:cell fate (sporulation/competence/biofilm development) regulator YlbF (YheA/YmcA/DUF963 family)